MHITEENVNELRSMSGLRLTILRNTHNVINAMSVLWLVVAGYMIYFKAVEKPDAHNSVFDTNYFITIGFYVVSFVAVLTRTKAGWLIMMMLGLWTLQFLPLGIVVTAGCWYCGITGVKLFGPRKLTAKQIQSEFDYRVHKYGFE